jgi:hypothetical protein
MSRTAFTLRIETEERNALKNLSKIEGRPINQLLNEAIRIYLGQRGRRERTQEANLKTHRDYRKKDPGFRRAIAVFADAEATVSDPLEGQPIEGDEDNNSPTPAGPVQSKVREVIGA